MISQKGAVLQIALDVHVGLKFRISKCFLLLPKLKCEFVFNPFLYCKSFCVGKIKMYLSRFSQFYHYYIIINKSPLKRLLIQRTTHSPNVKPNNFEIHFVLKFKPRYNQYIL